MTIVSQTVLVAFLTPATSPLAAFSQTLPREVLSLAVSVGCAEMLCLQASTPALLAAETPPPLLPPLEPVLAGAGVLEVLVLLLLLLLLPQPPAARPRLASTTSKTLIFRDMN